MVANRTALAAAGAVGALVLAACGGAGDAEDAAPAEDAAADEQAIGDAVPALSDIEEDIWDSMLAAESVHVTIANEEIVANLSNVPGTEVEAFSYSGAVDGSAIAVHYGDFQNAQLFFADAVYLGEELTFNMFDEIYEDRDISPLRERLDGFWMLTEHFDPDEMDFRLSELVADLRGDDSSDAEGTEADTISDEGTAEVRDGDDVWVYPAADGEGELVLTADRDAPYMLELTTDDLSLEFSDWNDAEVPSPPAADTVLANVEVDTMALEAITDSQIQEQQEMLEEIEELLED